MNILLALTAATVFLSGAELKQTEVLTLQKGENEVRIEGLSPNLNQSSLQLSIHGGAVITSSLFYTDYLTASSAQQDALQQALAKKQDALKALLSQQATLVSSLSLLEKGVESSISSDKVTPATVETNIRFYQTKSAALQAEKAANEKAVSETEEEIKTLERQINELSTRGRTRSGVLRLTINSPKAQKQALQIQYFTPSASWAMGYDLYVEGVNKPMTLTKKVLVNQTTGLDWTNVRLTLSTAAPTRSKEIPELSAWFVRQQQERRYRTTMAMKTNMLLASAGMSEMNVATEEDAEASMADFVTTNEQALSIEYQIDLPYSVQGNGKPVQIALGEERLEDVSYAYYLVPKYNTDVFLAAEINHWSSLNLLDGLAAIHYNGTYLGQTYLNTSSTAAAIRVSLGVDPQIQAKREQVAEWSATKVLGNTKTQSYGYKTTIRNNKKEPVQIIVKDQIPVSADKDIKVSLSDKTTAGYQMDKDKGILTYTLTLQAGEEKGLYLGYELKYPKDYTLSF